MDNNKKIEKRDDFLLAKYNSLQQDIRNTLTIQSTRLNFYFILIGIISAGYINTIENQQIPLYIFFLILLILAIFVLIHNTVVSESVVRLRIKQSEIRTLFEPLNENDGVPLSDDEVKFANGFIGSIWRGAEVILITLNGLIFSGFIYSLLPPSCYNVTILVLILSFLISLPLQMLIVFCWMKMVQKAEDNKSKQLID